MPRHDGAGLPRLRANKRATLMPRAVRCAVHYTAWAAATGEEVDNTRDAREPAQIIVSKGASCAAQSDLAAEALR